MSFLAEEDLGARKVWGGSEANGKRTGMETNRRTSVKEYRCWKSRRITGSHFALRNESSRHSGKVTGSRRERPTEGLT